MLQRFAIADLPPMPWKNGGGTTREIVCQPQGAGMDAFDWRVSIATIARSGPFSAFAGVDRSIMLLQGDGVLLESGGGISHRLDTPLQPFAFSGDLALQCTLLGGESTDFNVMTRRGAVRAQVQVLKTGTHLAPSPHGLLLALSGTWQVRPSEVALQAGCGLWWNDSPLSWNLQPQTDSASLVYVSLALDKV